MECEIQMPDLDMRSVEFIMKLFSVCDVSIAVLTITGLY